MCIILMQVPKPILIMANSPSSTIVITDTSCFIILDKLDLLDLLPILFSNVITTPEIAKEYGKALPEWVIIQSVKNSALQKDLANIVDAGEASAIALANEINCIYLLTDDKAARKLAEGRGIVVKGSIGLLLYAKEQGALLAIKPYLDKIQATNFRISAAIIYKALNQAGE
jgi:predicted nucleic acid-binding protein